MRTEDLQILAGMGRALWADPERSRRGAIEAVTAASLLDLPPDRLVERAAQAMLRRATAGGAAANARENLAALNDPLYRLEPEERFLLVALHAGRWSYARLCRILGDWAPTPERLQEEAWRIRVGLAGSYPAGPATSGPNCPTYEASRPWMQRFLDDEVSAGRERLFLQNHLMACDSCRSALGRCRDAYYAVDRLVTGMGDADTLEELRVAAAAGAALRPRAPGQRSARLAKMTLAEALGIFVRRPDVIAVLAIAGVALALRLVAS